MRLRFEDVVTWQSGQPASTSSEPQSESAHPATGPDLRAVDDDARTQALPRCPHCHQTLPLPASGMDEIICPECGSSFRLERGDSASTVDYRRSFGGFELLEKMGQANGAVWKAWDTILQRVVAVKIPHFSLLADSTYAERLQREARAAARLEHPGIVRLYEARTIEGARS